MIFHKRQEKSGVLKLAQDAHGMDNNAHVQDQSLLWKVAHLNLLQNQEKSGVQGILDASGQEILVFVKL